MSEIKILYLGDVVGRSGRLAIIHHLSAIRKLHDIDFVIANVENASMGAGITKEHAEELHHAGVDLMTLGDHVWDRFGFEQAIDGLDYICRPANLPADCPGRIFVSGKCQNMTIGVSVVLGRTFMKINGYCPFMATDAILAQHRSEVDVMFLEIHAEATSEKVAYGRVYDGKVTTIVGSHTHVQTADDGLLPKGSAYITDLGMSGPHDSVLGRELAPVVHAMRTSMPQKFEVATKDVRLSGVVVTVGAAGGGLPSKITRFHTKVA